MRYEPAAKLMRLLLALAASREGLTIDQIAEQSEVSRRTAERMLEAVERFCPPIESWDEVERRKRWRLPALPRGLEVPSVEELSALQLGAAALARDGLAPQAAALRRLGDRLCAGLDRAKALQVAPDVEALAEAEGFALRPGPREPIDPAVFETLREALKACCKVRIDVRYRGTGRTGYQTVHPYGFLYGARQYLVAYSELEAARDVRLFVLSGISRATLLEESFTPVDGFSLADYASRSFGVFQETPVRVAWRVAPKAAAEARGYVFHPGQVMTDLPDGGLRVEFTAGGLLEMCWHLFTWGDAIEILEPPALVEMMRRQLETALAAQPRATTSGSDVAAA